MKNLYIIDTQIKERKLETVIHSFLYFRVLLNDKINKLTIGESKSLKSILGKSARRLNDRAAELEAELIKNIQAGLYTKLKRGTVMQHQEANKPSV
ncbi:hypothetical protein [Mucilaginibacter lacusdianchii]|uniref:hypothetical protein n=1 Tax=Mucilaginibacter lacusdianchii TaxID=2684211 RepID=UPI00131BE4CC|nr:hypothetical protein [Mucilaginibacter sp. JXJ CY 39]